MSKISSATDHLPICALFDYIMWTAQRKTDGIDTAISDLPAIHVAIWDNLSAVRNVYLSVFVCP